MDFDKLLTDVIQNPELILDNTVIDNDSLLEIQKRLNPYIGLVDNTDSKQIAVCSYTNLREDYIRRFTMTSFVSFIFQMLYEYEVPVLQRTWKPTSGESDKLFDIKDLKDKLLSICDILGRAETADEEKSIGMLFTVTTMLRDLGLVADSKMNVTLQEANKFPEIKKIIETKKHVTSNYPEREFPADNAKQIITTFLNNYLSYDPSIHIRNAYDKDKIRTEVAKINNENIVVDADDPNHLTFETLKLKLEAPAEDKEHLDNIMHNNRIYNACVHILKDENSHDSIRYMLDNLEKFKYYLTPVKKLEDVSSITPPQDTFHRWNYFTEVNYEELRTITECLYPERPDLDWALAIWTTFRGESDEELDKQFNDYCQKNQDNMPSIMKSLEIGKWCLLADFKENRKNIQFYNKHTDVLKKIIERHTEDKKIGTELMRNRVKQVKAKNIAESGPDAAGLKAYKSNMSENKKDLVSKGVEQVITPEEMKRLEKAQGNIKAAKELEYIEEYERIIDQLEDIKKYRELSSAETEKYNLAISNVKQAKEMLYVPDNAIQVDVFSTDPKTGKFSKSHFYTKCDEALVDEESK